MFVELTRPVEPIALELLAVVAVEHLVDAHDVAGLVGQWSPAGGLEGRPGDGGRLLVHVHEVVAEVAQILRLEALERGEPGRVLPLLAVRLLPTRHAVIDVRVIDCQSLRKHNSCII